MISINKLSINFTGDFLFKDISFVVGDKERIGLVGKNGAGKSTLLKIIHGLVTPETGNMVITQGYRTGYLPQELDTIYHKTIWDEAVEAFVEEKKLETKIEKLTRELTLRNDFSSEAYLAISQQLVDATERFHYLEGDSMTARTEKVLLGLGFKTTDFHRPMHEFSSGWQMRVELAKILLQQSEIILLDEPTNHLDIESIQWLEDYLMNYEGALILVSHDRAFLDRVTQRTIEITFAEIEDYKCSYSEYVTQRLERIASQQATYENQQKEIADIERFIERFRYKSSKAKQVQSRVKMLDKMEKVEVESIDKRSISFRFPSAPHTGRVVVEAQNATLGYEQLEVLQQINFSLLRGERVAFVGRNGEGKSTFVKAIVGELAPKSGIVQRGHQVKIGYYAQNQALLLNPEKTVYEMIDEVAVGDIRTQIRTILGKFLFTTEDTTKKVKVLSGGEKSRLALAKLLLSPVNLLILDEPTNHLDMNSKAVLKNALLQYTGSMILVSHDRDFLQGLTEKVVEFKDKTIAVHLGDIYDFLEKRKIATLQEVEKKDSISSLLKEKNKISITKMEYEEKKKQESQKRKIENQIAKIEKEIGLLTQKIKKIEDKLADPATFVKEISSGSLYKEYENLRKEITKKEQLWDKLIEENL